MQDCCWDSTGRETSARDAPKDAQRASALFMITSTNCLLPAHSWKGFQRPLKVQGLRTEACPCRENMLNCCRTHYCCSSNDYKSILDCCPQRLLSPYITPREQAQVANKRAIWCGSLHEQRRKSSFNMPPPPHVRESVSDTKPGHRP